MRVFYEDWDKVLNHRPLADDLALNEKLHLTGQTSFQSALVIILK